MTTHNATYGDDYSTHILANRWQTALSGIPSSMYFSTEKTSPFAGIVSRFSASVSETPLVSFHTLTPPSMTEPYFPFLSIIRDYITSADIEPESILDIADVYPPQRELFLACLTISIPHRKDILLPEEVSYERRQIQRSLFALLQFISRRKPLIIAIDGLRNAGPALLDFLLYMQNHGEKARIFCIYAFARNFHWIDEEERERWDSFLLSISEKITVFDLGNDNFQTEACEPPVASWSRVSPEELVRFSRLNQFFLSYDEALLCGREAYPGIFGLSGPSAERLQYYLLNTLGDAHYYCGQHNQAIIQYQAITEKAQRTDNYKELARSYRKTGLSYLGMGDLDSAKRFSLLDIKITEERLDNANRVYSYFFSFFLSIRNSTNIGKEMYYSLHNMLKDQNLENMYAYFAGNSVSYSYYYNGFPELLRISDESISYYIKNKNEYGLSSAYHQMGILHSNNAQYGKSFIYLKKSLRLREQIGNPLYIVRVQNGLGYLYYLTNDYLKAFSSFKSSLRLLSRVNAYEETTATLYNIAMLYFVTCNFDKCSGVLDKILKIMHILKIPYLPYHSIQDVYIMQALCSLKMDKFTTALELIHKVLPFEFELPWKPRFLFCLLRAMAYSYQGDTAKALNLFRAAPELLKRADEKNGDILPCYYYEYAKALIDNDRGPEAGPVIEEGVSFCQSIGSDFHRRRIAGLGTAEIAAGSPFELGSLRLNLDTLVEIAKQEFVLGRLQNKMRDIRFLNLIQTELMLLHSRSGAAQKLIKLLSHHFPMEIISIRSCEDGRPGLVLAQIMSDIEDPSILAGVFEHAVLFPDKRRFEGAEIKNLFPEISIPLAALTSIPIMSGGLPTAWVFIATKKSGIALTHEDLEILMLTAAQVGILFEKIQHDEEMIRVSYRDELSQLNNRQAMQVKIREESLRIDRIKNRADFNFSVAFIDLDNFKYYNDTFGHGVGDMIIREFSRLLMNTFREIDFIVRYGGDEFVVLMPDTNETEASIPLQRIYTELRNKRYFMPKIEEIAGKGAAVPEANRISCSIGLASFETEMEGDTIIADLLQKADHALYEAKKTGKHRLQTWKA
jgi:diguanylate cyclase (GGDEF)-like protein